MEESTDNELMEAVRQGNLDALGELFQRHHERVHALCYRLVGDAVAADDLVQESFLRVLRYRRTFAARAAFTTWLYRIVRNTCLDSLKAEDRKLKKREAAAAEAEVLGPENGAANPRHTMLKQALDRLPLDRREVLVLSRYEGLSYAEIATTLETTVGAIKVRAHRAMRELRQIFEELERQHEV